MIRTVWDCSRRELPAGALCAGGSGLAPAKRSEDYTISIRETDLYKARVWYEAVFL